ncbi:hypothetical protein SEA_PHAYETA_38 [Mycobacterium phage Phayeta]|nr:hypothetical protein SEA_PHAYETA_38 [Mycobacterium phage Phayeta]
MSIKICTSEHMLSTVNGLDMRRNWFPRIAAERFLKSEKDGEIKSSPDPVTMIDGDLTWFNNSDEAQVIAVQVKRAPRTVVAQSPSTVLITDAWTFDLGKNPSADQPTTYQDTFGGKMQIDRPEARAEDLKFGRLFYDSDSSQAWVPCGVLEPYESIHFRYLAAVYTPGVWTTPTEFEPRWEAFAYWARLLCYASPVGSQ